MFCWLGKNTNSQVAPPIPELNVRQTMELRVDEFVDIVYQTIKPNQVLFTNECCLSTGSGPITLRTGKIADAATVRGTMLRLEIMKITAQQQFNGFVGRVHQPGLFKDVDADTACSFGLMTKVVGPESAHWPASNKRQQEVLKTLSLAQKSNEFTGEHFRLSSAVVDVILAGTVRGGDGFDLICPEVSVQPC